MFIENNILKAEIEILDTECGIFLKEYLQECVFTTRSIGYVDKFCVVNIDKFYSIDAIYYKDDSYYNLRIRKKKLERILND